MKKLLLFLLAIGVGVAIFIYFSYSATKPEKPVPADKPAQKDQPGTTISRSADPKMQLPGTVVPETVEIVAFKVGGILENGEANFRKGQKFRKNQLLFQVNNREAFEKMLADKTTLKQKIDEILDLVPSSEKEKWEAFSVSLGPASLIAAFPEISNPQEKQLITSQNIEKDYQKIKKQEAAMADYFYIAPFDGKILELYAPVGIKLLKNESVAQIAKDGKLCIVSDGVEMAQLKTYTESPKKIFVYNAKNELIGQAKIAKTKDNGFGSTNIYFSVDNWRKLKPNEKTFLKYE